MSWLSDNYEKAALGGAVVITLALGAVVIGGKGSLEEAFERQDVKPNKDVGVPGLKAIKDTKESFGQKGDIPHYDVTGRKVDLMTGVALFVKRGDLSNPVDLHKGANVHKGIPNDWWLKNRIDPGYSDSPLRDPDEDGFSNKEEYVAKTNPNDFGSYPEPMGKLSVEEVVSTQYLLKPSGFGGDKYKFKLMNSREIPRNKMGADPIVKGTVIPFTGELMKDRLKFVGVEEREQVKHGIKQMLKIWLIEDMKPNKAGTKYYFNRQGRRVSEGVPIGIVDSTVELTLNALKQDGKSFKVEENMKFSLPYDENATVKPYLLKKVDVRAKSIEIEYSDPSGVKKTHRLSYGG